MSKLKALIVDDDDSIARGVAMRLEAIGFDTRVAHDGSKGLEAVTSYQPDLMVLDVRMPILDGLEVLERLANDPRHDFPVIMVSASLQDQDRALDAGASYFLKKPYEGSDLALAAQMVTGAAV
ncbi:response regulator transcription factor [Roseiconus lacunae]|uniref:Response regulator n=1 Tax=Roseiconus lacunae TaxID=2605694 RepID=A0ABT7PE77_9BACT|nr:response regulator [Roseiconus lacunae]MCD0463637.1 response regulator [Roseiconus lacunae]MDM4014805.1 response regulator [Roseiconus lacunae]WRQ50396.1 response regulator [Stieleria sp. HD01]